MLLALLSLLSGQDKELCARNGGQMYTYISIISQADITKLPKVGGLKLQKFFIS